MIASEKSISGYLEKYQWMGVMENTTEYLIVIPHGHNLLMAELKDGKAVFHDTYAHKLTDLEKSKIECRMQCYYDYVSKNKSRLGSEHYVEFLCR